MGENIEKTSSKSFSIYPSDFSLIHDHAEENGLTDSDALRDILNKFFEFNKKIFKRDIYLHILYPGFLCIFVFIIVVITGNLNDILYHKNLYFNELYVFNRACSVLSFGLVSFFAVNFYVMAKKYYKRHEK